jgi:hypothetical protein
MGLGTTCQRRFPKEVHVMGDDGETPEVVGGELVTGRTEAAVDKRVANLKPWKPGQSGNPSGWSKLSRELRMYIAGAEGEGTREDIDGIRELARKAKSEFVRLQARTWLAEQVVGKSSQPLTFEDEAGNKLNVGIIVLPAERSDDE